jgi:hypothetical protein
MLIRVPTQKQKGLASMKSKMRTYPERGAKEIDELYNKDFAKRDDKTF